MWCEKCLTEESPHHKAMIATGHANNLLRLRVNWAPYSSCLWCFNLNVCTKLMAPSHCTATGTGAGQGTGLWSRGSNIWWRNVYTGIRQGQGPRPINHEPYRGVKIFTLVTRWSVTFPYEAQLYSNYCYFFIRIYLQVMCTFGYKMPLNRH